MSIVSKDKAELFAYLIRLGDNALITRPATRQAGWPRARARGRDGDRKLRTRLCWSGKDVL